MKITETESVEDRYLRENYIYSHRKEDFPIIIVLVLLMIFGVLYYNWASYSNQVKVQGSGNPYMCEACKNLGYACKEHRGFDKDAYLENKINTYCSRYTLGDSDEDSKYAMYGYGKQYNSECDFCNKEKEECYSCRYDRNYITSLIEDISKTDQFKTKLCDECWKLGYAHCDKCYEMLGYEVLSTIKGEEVTIKVNSD